MWWPKHLNLSTLKRILLLIDEKINLKKNLKMNLNNIHGVLILILIHTAYVMESSRTPATTMKIIATNHPHNHHHHHHRRPNTTSTLIRVTTKDDHDCGGVRKAGKNSYPVSLLNSAAKRLKKADVSLPDLTKNKKKVNAKKLKLTPPAKKSITKPKRVNSSKPQKSKTHQPIKQSTTKTNKSTKTKYRSVKSAIGTILKSVTKLNKLLRELN